MSDEGQRSCANYFSQCCGKNIWQKQLKEGHVLAHSLRVQSILAGKLWWLNICEPAGDMRPQSENKQRWVLVLSLLPFLSVPGPSLWDGAFGLFGGYFLLIKVLWNTPEKCPEVVSLGDPRCCQVDRINHPRSLNILNGKNIKYVNSVDYKLHISEFDFKKKEMVAKNELLKKQLRFFFTHHCTDSQFQLENILFYCCDKIPWQTK